MCGASRCTASISLVSAALKKCRTVNGSWFDKRLPSFFVYLLPLNFGASGPLIVANAAAWAIINEYSGSAV